MSTTLLSHSISSECSLSDDLQDFFSGGSSSTNSCENCGKMGAKLRCRNNCGKVFYCEDACQRNHARSHRLLCFEYMASASSSNGYQKRGPTMLLVDDDSDTDTELEDKDSFRRSLEKRVEQKLLKKLKREEDNRIAKEVQSQISKLKIKNNKKKLPAVSLPFPKQSTTSMDDDIEDCLDERESSLHYQSEWDFRESSLSDVESLDEADRCSSEVYSTMGDMIKWDNNNAYLQSLKFFVWGGGPVGFKLQEENQDGGALFVHGIETASEIYQSGIRNGDRLESVADILVNGMSPTEAMELLFTSDIPSVLRFQAKNQYSNRELYYVTWDHGKLGVTFRASGDEEIPIIHRLTARSESAAIKYGIKAGDILVAINEFDAIELGCKNALSMLMTIARPVILCLQRCKKPKDPAPHASTPSMLNYAALNKPRNKALDRIAKQSGTIFRSLQRSPIVHKKSSSPEVEEPMIKDTKDQIDQEFKIKWKDGWLGVTFVNDFVSGHMKVNRLTGKGISLGLSNLQHGDILVSINGMPLKPNAFHENCVKLRACKKPCVLNFRTEAFQNTQIARVPLVRSRSIFGMYYSRMSCESPRAFEKDYEVLWKGDTIGLIMGFRREKVGKNEKKNSDASSKTKRKEPFIRVFKRTESSLKFPKSDPTGDILVAVNNERTDGIDATCLMHMFHTAAKPAVLRFRASESDDNDYRENSVARDPSLVSVDTESNRSSNESTSSSTEYKLLWNEEKLGITFVATESMMGPPKVKKVVGGCAEKSNLVREGDSLESINGKIISTDQIFSKTMELLQKLRKPVVLGLTRNVQGKDEAIHQISDRDDPMAVQPSLRRHNSMW